MLPRYRSEDRGFFSEMNFTPFVDIIFVMMIIFMITAPFTQKGIDVKLPKEEAKEVNLKESPVVSITEDKRIFLNNRRITLEDMEKKLNILARNKPDIEIFLKADKNVLYGEVVKVMATIKKAGIERLGMVTEQPPQKRKGG